MHNPNSLKLKIQMIHRRKEHDQHTCTNNAEQGAHRNRGLVYKGKLWSWWDK